MLIYILIFDQLNINYTTDLSKKLFYCREDSIIRFWEVHTVRPHG